MARNEEKHCARLNRIYLKQQKDEYEKKNPKRPRLDELQSGNEIKQWLPSIKRDIDFCLKQSQVPCYPKSKIEEFDKRIDYLKREYRAFVRKLRDVNPDITSVPWTERGYEAQKRKCNPALNDNDEEKKLKNVEKDSEEVEERGPQQFTCIFTPVLDKDYTNTYGYTKPGDSNQSLNVNDDLQNQPLCFVSGTPSSTQTNNTVSNIKSNYLKKAEQTEADEKDVLPTSEPDKAQHAAGHNLLHISYLDSSDSDG